MLSLAIKSALKKVVHDKDLHEVMDYAVFPAGKLFRPKLVEALALDLNQKVSQDHLHLASAIELHHAYTLVHDDLPSMDNDFIRRGKPATHAKFGEWKAILAGDALLIASFAELSNIKHQNFKKLHRIMGWTTGAKGLIEGQFLDLGADGKVPIKKIIRIHELKTARLIQLATLGSYYLTEVQNLRGTIEFMRLGREIGVSFQLLDDLSELSENEVSEHEKSINPFLISPIEALNELRLSHLRLTAITFKHRLSHIDQMLNDYYRANQKNLLQNMDNLEKNITGDLTALKKWITSFV